MPPSPSAKPTAAARSTKRPRRCSSGASPSTTSPPKATSHWAASTSRRATSCAQAPRSVAPSSSNPTSPRRTSSPATPSCAPGRPRTPSPNTRNTSASRPPASSPPRPARWCASSSRPSPRRSKPATNAATKFCLTTTNNERISACRSESSSHARIDALNLITSELHMEFRKERFMRINKRACLSILILIVITVVTTVLALRVRTQSIHADNKQPQNDTAESDQRFPTAEYEEAEITDPAKRARRMAKNQRYDRRRLVKSRPDKSIVATTRVSEWEVGLPAIPSARSHTVVLGEVLDAQAHLSNDKTGVYSEFDVRVVRVFKNLSNSLSPGDTITVEREGGY